jgi:hypothetical protein
VNSWLFSLLEHTWTEKHNLHNAIHKKSQGHERVKLVMDATATPSKNMQKKWNKDV